MINNKIEISDQKHKLVMSIERDRIWVDPSVSVSEATQAVIDALQEYIVGMVDEAVKKERDACIEDARTVGGDAGAEVEKLNRARGHG